MDTGKDRREEVRYPIASVYRKYILCKLLGKGATHTETEILDFSMHGIKIKSPVYAPQDSEIDCVISLPKLYQKDMRAKLKVVYSTPVENS